MPRLGLDDALVYLVVEETSSATNTSRGAVIEMMESAATILCWAARQGDGWFERRQCDGWLDGCLMCYIERGRGRRVPHSTNRPP
jgi:hypothetical protein